MDTVDGPEIRLTNQLICKTFHYSLGFIHRRWLFGISEPSIVTSHYTIYTDGIMGILIKFIYHDPLITGNIESLWTDPYGIGS